MNGTVGWLKLTGEDDPIITFFLSLKPNIININARKKFTFRDIDTKLQPVLNDLNIPPFAWSQFEYAANAWLIVRGTEDNAHPPRLIASGTVSHATTLNKVFDIQSMLIDVLCHFPPRFDLVSGEIDLSYEAQTQSKNYFRFVQDLKSKSEKQVLFCHFFQYPRCRRLLIVHRHCQGWFLGN